MIVCLPSSIAFLARYVWGLILIVVVGCSPLIDKMPTDLSWTSNEPTSPEKNIESTSAPSNDPVTDTFEHLSAKLNDPDVLARVAAVEGLAELGTPEGKMKLREQFETADERVRTTSVTALTSLGDEQILVDAAGDRSWRVRAEAARALARFPNRSSAELAGKLIEDANATVQHEAVRATVDWPLELAGPILFKGLEKPSYRPRASAAKQLAALWPTNVEFPVEATPERRAKAFGALRERYEREIGPLPVERQQVVEKHPSENSTSTPSELARTDRLLDQLGSSDLAVRRWASAELAKLTAERPLESSSAWRLAQVASTEQDDLVWKYLLRTIAKDPSESSSQLAYAAIGHRSPEVRRRACQHLGRHPDPAHVAVLSPAVCDPSETVVVAAVRALSAIGQIDRLDTIRELLNASNETVRLEAAMALVRLDDPTGPAALRRLASSPHEQVRLRTAVAMGEVPEPSFTSQLIAMLDDRQSIRRAALESLPKVVGHDASESGGTVPSSLAERIVRWKYWYSQSRTIVLDDDAQKATIEE